MSNLGTECDCSYEEQLFSNGKEADLEPLVETRNAEVEKKLWE